MKKCTKCDELKDESDYYVKDSKTNRLHAQCKTCYKEHRATYYTVHYQRYKPDYLARAKKRRDKLKQEYRDFIIQFLDGKRCVDCGEKDIRVLELDHESPTHKEFSVSQGVKLGYNIKQIEAEAAKCQVRCANCHKKRTATQFGWHKANTGGTERI